MINIELADIMLQCGDVRGDFWVMAGEGVDAVGSGADIADPFEGFISRFRVFANARKHHIFP